MNGQWIGPYSGTNQGLLVLDLDDAGDHYEGSASALDRDSQLPPTFADFIRTPIPKGKTEFDLTVPLMPIDRLTGNITTWEEVKKHYPTDVTVPSHAKTHWKIATDRIELSWSTDVGTHGNGIVEKSRGQTCLSAEASFHRLGAACAQQPTGSATTINVECDKHR